MAQNQYDSKSSNRAAIIRLSIFTISTIVIAFGYWVGVNNKAGLLVIIAGILPIILTLGQWLLPMTTIQIPRIRQFRKKSSKYKEELFISYHQADSIWAEWMAYVLRQKGYATMLQPWSTASKFIEEMKRIDEEAEYIFIILSSNYLEQLKDEEEWLHDFEKGNPQRKKRSAFCVHKLQTEEKLSHIPFINLIGLNEKDTTSRVLEHVPAKIRGKHSPKPQEDSSDVAQKVASDGGENLLAEEPIFPGFVLNIPKCHPFFVGYKHILEQLYDDWLKSKRHNSFIVPRAVNGFIGSGKTRTVIEYVNQYRNHYRYVFWVNALSKNKLEEGFKDIATILLKDDARDHVKDTSTRLKDDTEELITAVKRKLEESSDILLILDKCEDLHLVAHFIPQQTKCHILLTTSHGATGQFQNIKLSGLEPCDGARLLLHRAKREDATQEEQATAKEISREMAGLPLALNHAGAYIESTGYSLVDFLILYQKERAALLEQKDEFHLDYPHSVATVLSLAIYKINKNANAAYELLLLLACFHPEAIPLEIISKGAQYLGPTLQPIATHPLQLNDAIKDLLSISLINRHYDVDANAEVVSIHRLLQVVLHGKHMNKSEQHLWSERAVLATSQAFPAVKFENWPLCRLYQPQVETCMDLVKQWNIESPEVAQLFDQVGCYLRERAFYQRAEDFLAYAYAMRNKLLPVDSPQIATSQSNIAELFHIQGKYVEAEELYKKALHVREQHLGLQHLDTAATMNNLARLYEDWGKYDNNEIKRRYEEVLVIHLAAQANGQDEAELDVAMSWNNIAETLYKERRYNEAKEYHQKALGICKRRLGEKHPDVIRINSNMAKDYIATDDSEYAETLLVRAFRSGKEMLGEEHPIVAARLNNLAQLYYQQKKYDQSLSHYEEALRIYRSSFGSEHPLIADVLLNKATLLEKKNKSYYKATITSLKLQAEEIRTQHRRQNPV